MCCFSPIICAHESLNWFNCNIYQISILLFYAASYKPDGRLSPTTLGRRMEAELQLLDGVDLSVTQLTGVEKCRAIALAQQESVSLAQILKVNYSSLDI